VTAGAGGATGGSIGSGGQGGGAGAGITVNLTVNPSTVGAGDTTTGTVTVTNFVLEQPSGQPNADGHGHYTIYLDAASGGNYLVRDFAMSTAITIPTGTAPGPHTLTISLRENSSAPLAPPVSDTVAITVQ
jgi:hypothetical protein